MKKNYAHERFPKIVRDKPMRLGFTARMNNTDTINTKDNATFTAEWALSPTAILREPRLGSPASDWADYNASLTLAGMKRNRRKELGIGEFAANE